MFKEKFDGYVFIDRDGGESQCLVEYSAYQKTPNATKKTKKDMKSETIDEDPDFLGIFSWEDQIDLPRPSEITDKDWSTQVNLWYKAMKKILEAL